jgi:hypothetical protein
MESGICQPPKIPIEKLLHYFRNMEVKPPEGINIPGITITSQLASKKRSTEAPDTIMVNIRKLFNRLTTENVPEIIAELKKIVYLKVSTVSDKDQAIKLIEDIAEEMLQLFIIDGKNIPGYMHLLNAIHNNTTVLAQEKTIGHYFLDKCRLMIISLTSRENIEKLAKLAVNMDDINDRDSYRKQQEKVTNLITLLCHMYKQRNTTNIKLTASHLFHVVKRLLDFCQTLQNELNQLNMDDDDDFELSEIYIKMCSIYSEHLFTFMLIEGIAFAKDPTVVAVRIKEANDEIKTSHMVMSDLINRFKQEIVPKLTEPFLKSKIQMLEI